MMVVVLVSTFACSDPDGVGAASLGVGGATTGVGGATAGAKASETGGVAGTSATSSSGSGGCEFACGGGLGTPSPGGVTTPQAGSAGTAGAAGGAAKASCSPGQPLCDDFESYAAGQAPTGRWQPVKTASQGASLVVDATKAFSGKQALHVKVAFTGNGGSVNIGTKPGDQAFSDGAATHYARFMLFQTTPQVSGELHARLFRLGTMNAPSGSNGTGYAFSLHSYPKPVAIQLESMNDLYVKTRVEPPVDKWVCWETQFGAGAIGWWRDGETVASPVPGGWPQVALEMLEVGFETFTPVTAELWLDDIAVDTKRIGCPEMP